MKQKIKAILDDDRGVSPVIGVILMVAITVILAAVIGTFVLGLGDSLQQAPQAQLNADSEAASSLNISHTGGDAIPFADITIQVNSTEFQRTDFNNPPSDELSVGDSIGVDLDAATSSGPSGWAYSSGSTVEVTIIHNPSESILLDTEVDTQG